MKRKELFYFLYIIFLYSPKSLPLSEKKLTFKDENMKVVASFNLESLKQRYKIETVQVFNFITQKRESYKAFDLSKILDHVYGINKWKNSYALGTISTDKYAPIIKRNIFNHLKPYLAYGRADGEKFIRQKNFSQGTIDLAPYYIIWKTPKSIGNLKKVRNHWPWKIQVIFLLLKEPPAIKTSDRNAYSGKETFINHCIACHSIHGVGGTKGGDLLSVIKTKNLSDQYLSKYILNPRKTNPKSKMPHFPIYLDDKENRIKKLILYLRDRLK